MAKERTDKSRYPSRYSPGGFVTSAQYIIELTCERMARKEGKDLPANFWQLPEWEKIYKSQLRATHKLLKTYDAVAIIKVLQTKNIWSLRAKWVEQLIAKEQKILDGKRLLAAKEAEKNAKNEVEIDGGKLGTERPLYKKGSKLLSLDDE